MRPIHDLIGLCSLTESLYLVHYNSASSWDTEVALVIDVYGTEGFDLSDPESVTGVNVFEVWKNK